MTPEFKIREVKRYVITQHDSRGSRPLVQVDNLETAEQILSALQLRSELEPEVDPAVAARMIPIDDLGFSTLTRNNYVVNCGFKTAGDIADASLESILKIRRVGAETVNEARLKLNSLGISHKLGKVHLKN